MASPTSSHSADRAFLLAVRSWGELSEADWRRFDPALAERTAADWEFLQEHGPDPARAVESLRHELHAQSKPDLSRIHPSWIRRALQGESPAVRRLLAARGPEPLPSLIRAWFGETPQALDHEPDRESVEIALAAWSERLIGDVLDREDDPPALTLLARLRIREGYRIVEAIGLMKLAFLPIDLRPALGRRKGRLLERFSREPASNRDKIASIVKAELIELDQPKRNVDLLLGLATVARLTRQVDPYRVRWALQNQPYAVAKLVRAAQARPLGTKESILAWDARLLRKAVVLAASRLDASELIRKFA